MEAIIQDQWRRAPIPSRRRSPTTADRTVSSTCQTARRPLAIDAKFPLEAFNLHSQRGERGTAQVRAGTVPPRLHKAHSGHRRKIPAPGETQDTAFLFVPSESIFAELNENFEDLVQKPTGPAW
jgi:DNA recombination protein RmuC